MASARSALLRIPLAALSAGERELEPEAANYAIRVHRLRAGEAFVAFDTVAKVEADAEVVRIQKQRAVVRIGALRPAAIVAQRRVTWLQSIGKADKVDAVVRDATELGATDIVVVQTERTVAKRQSSTAADRWTRITLEAARQCGRGDAPNVVGPVPFAEAVSALGAVNARGGRSLVLVVGAAETLASALDGVSAETEMAVLVGPEGGLTSDEIDECAAAGAQAVSLGPVVLRTETACAAVLGAIQLRGASPYAAAT